MACLVLIYFFMLFHKQCDFRKKKNFIKYNISILTTTFIWNIPHSKKNWDRYDLNVYLCSCKVPFILARPWQNLNLFDRFSKNAQISNLIKIRPVGAELFHADRQTDRQTHRRTDVTQLIVALRYCVKATNNVHKTFNA